MVYTTRLLIHIYILYTIIIAHIVKMFLCYFENALFMSLNPYLLEFHNDNCKII